MAFTFQKATKKEAKLRMALDGPAGSGKTFTSLKIGSQLGARVALVDTERGSASKYSDLFNFDVLELNTFSPESYVEAIKAAEAAGYDVLIIDSLSAAWTGSGGALEMVNKAQQRDKSGNSFTAWRDITPLHNKMVDTILSTKMHVIVTMRTKTEYVMQAEERNGRTYNKPVKIGMAPIQRDGMEYEFDVVADLDWENNFIVSKSRCPQLSGQVYKKAGEDVAEVLKVWLTGEKVDELDSERADKIKSLYLGGGYKKPLEEFLQDRFSVNSVYKLSAEKADEIILKLEAALTKTSETQGATN